MADVHMANPAILGSNPETAMTANLLCKDSDCGFRFKPCSSMKENQ